MAGRKKDSIWNYFHEVKTLSGKGSRAKCKFCGKEIQGIVSRLKVHHVSCQAADNFNDCIEDGPERQGLSTTPQPGPSNCSTTPKRTPENADFLVRKKFKMDTFVTRTTPEQKKELDTQMARMIYATNSAFHMVENKEFKKCIEKLRPGYSAPRESAIGGHLLTDVYDEELKKCAQTLKNESVSLSIDGWANVAKEPIVCSSITTKEGRVYLLETFDTSGNKHTSEYLQEICEKSIETAREKFHCQVRSVVTDNAANMAKMRNEVGKKSEDVDDNSEDYDIPIITYGCSAHLLNLLAKDLHMTEVTEHVVQIAKYFRNHDFVRAPYKTSGGSSLLLPQEVRWNSMCDCLESYIKNWPILVTIVEKNKDEIDPTIKQKVLNVSIKRNAEDMVAFLKPIANTLDHMQSNSCCISDAVALWKTLEEELDKILDRRQKSLFKKRYEQALTPAHFLAYLLNVKLRIKYPKTSITVKEKEAAIEFAVQKYGSAFSSIVLKLLTNSSPFSGTIMEHSLLDNLTPIEWWASLAAIKDILQKRELQIVQQLLSASASTAGVERIFSTFNLVHSKLRNRLGVEKAAKLVFLYKTLNG